MQDNKKRKYFIQQFIQEEYLHGGVGGSDAEKILLAKGFEPIYFPHHQLFSVKAKLSRFIFLARLIFKLKKGDTLVFIAPVYARINKLLLGWLRNKKMIRTICFIADINGLKDGDEKLLDKEIKFFRGFRYFIVHNDSMKDWLSANVASDSIAASIEFFDFLVSPVTPRSVSSYDVVFAGNLEKSQFISKLHLLEPGSQHVHFHLYGFPEPVEVGGQNNITWHGIKRPYELPGSLNGSFGLVWDGDSIDKPGGSLGNYMQYISHHKLSLYILSKLPLIVPAMAASAPLVKKYGIGFTVNSLYEIGDKIKMLPVAEYYQMQNNMESLAEKISKGQCLGDAIDRIINSAEF